MPIKVMVINKVKSALATAKQKFNSEIIIYIAWTDILDGAPLGALAISKQAIIQRDEIVFSYALENKIPIVMLLGSGYQKSNAAIISQ